jgi:hypothetical protein
MRKSFWILGLLLISTSSFAAKSLQLLSITEVEDSSRCYIYFHQKEAPEGFVAHFDFRDPYAASVWYRDTHIEKNYPISLLHAELARTLAAQSRAELAKIKLTERRIRRDVCNYKKIAYRLGGQNFEQTVFYSCNNERNYPRTEGLGSGYLTKWFFLANHFCQKTSTRLYREKQGRDLEADRRRRAQGPNGGGIQIIGGRGLE